ncbi:two-component system phosphate regulon sensor histidine kinase PhoR [Flavobacteriaceae bacterium MAR_2010_105]|nr:two-component system phosphate regulon sensor histidine kinase PhoR [Flavobacteriaceae bacterium MAR_2010_105]
MNDSRYKITLYLIVIVILSTIVIQVYWNYKNYLTNKQQLINDVQVSLDKAVDDYYAKLAERTTYGFTFDSIGGNDSIKGKAFQTIITSLDKGHKIFKNLDSIEFENLEGVSVFKGLKADSMFHKPTYKRRKAPDSGIQELEYLHPPSDSIKLRHIQRLTSKIVISISNDSLALKNLDTLIKSEFRRKQLKISYWVSFKNSDKPVRVWPNTNASDSLAIHAKTNLLQTTSKSTFLPRGSTLTLFFTNETQMILQRILGGILISTLLVLAVISSLFYLLKIIRQQKQLAEVKNDLISNITHEFKTPIATIGVALESIKNFNTIEDKEKIKRYLDMSSGQLSKLNTMVEKLLETATLDSDSLELNKESINILELIEHIIYKHKMQTNTKTITFNSQSDIIEGIVDVFHFENAINNILDNAIKYGGDEIQISIAENSFAFTVSISDNGTTITKTNKDRIFEKFYRIPKGNTHDVKGFGIGLYYTKTIIEKHQGSIHLELTNTNTIFKVTIPKY